MYRLQELRGVRFLDQGKHFYSQKFALLSLINYDSSHSDDCKLRVGVRKKNENKNK